MAEAVEAALKTALLATRRPGIIAFENAYHGLGYGALNVTHRKDFRFPFRSQLGESLVVWERQSVWCFGGFPSARFWLNPFKAEAGSTSLLLNSFLCSVNSAMKASLYCSWTK